VLVHSYQEVHVIALEAMVSRYGIGSYFFERVTLVRVGGSVIDCAGEEVLGQLLTAL
jgi:hypothetical protein